MFRSTGQKTIHDFREYSIRNRMVYVISGDGRLGSVFWIFNVGNGHRIERSGRHCGNNLKIKNYFEFIIKKYYFKIYDYSILARFGELNSLLVDTI